MLQARLKHSLPGFSLDLAFECRPGITVLYGPAAAGKSLLFQLLTGLATPSGGRIMLDDSILFDGETGVNLPPRLRRCGLVAPLFPHLTVSENLAFAAHQLPARERTRRVKETLDEFDLTAAAHRRPAALSENEPIRAAIARALIHTPRLLLLDDPARGLAPLHRQELYSILRSLTSLPVLLATSDLEGSVEAADSLLLLEQGRLLQAGPTRQVLDHPASPAAARLLGLHILLPAEILSLDPGRQTSRVRCLDTELTGPYYRGHLLGDRVTLCLLPSALRALPRSGAPAANQLPATLTHLAERTHSVVLHFNEGLSVEMPRAAFEPLRATREWLVELPPTALNIL
jgi:molybdate transport system ATP-binding protein